MMWSILLVLALAIGCLDADENTSPTDYDIMDEFIKIPEMRMDEYNFWWRTNSFRECAKFCVDEKRIYCRSFSISSSKNSGCGTYKFARDDVEQGMYVGKDIDTNARLIHWTYFERKTLNYKLLEQKMAFLENRTSINASEASEFLMGLNNDIEIALNITTGNETEANSTLVSPAELDIITSMITKVSDMNPVANDTLESSEVFITDVLSISNTMIKPALKNTWMSLQTDSNVPGIVSVVTSSEKVAKDVSIKIVESNSSSNFVREEEQIGLWMDVVDLDEEKTFFVKSSDLHMGVEEGDLSEDVFVFPKTKSTDNISLAVNDMIIFPIQLLPNKSVISNVRYKDLHESVPARISDVRNLIGLEYEMNSAVLSASIFPRPEKDAFENHPVFIVFNHKREPNITALEVSDKEETIECAYWETKGKYLSSGWSTDGCSLHTTNTTHTVCKCTHLTSFAVLMKIIDTKTRFSWEHRTALSWISTIGCILSLVGVSLMCGAFAMLKFRTENMRIHFNLGLAVGFANLVFLLIEPASKNMAACLVTTILLYYFNMSVLSWMLIEGLYLYFQVVVVFVSARRWVRHFIIAGWGIPGIICMVAMGILNIELNSNENCWLSAHNNSIWAFVGPAILVIIVNTFVLASVVKIIFKLQPDKLNNTKIQRTRNAVKGSVLLSPLLGTTWIFGLLSLTKYDLLFQYLFATTNSLQGFFLFVFHCLFNHEVRNDFARISCFTKQIKKNRSSSGPSKTPWFTGSLSFASSLRKFRHSIVSFDHPSTAPSSVSDSNDSPKVPTKQYVPTLPTLDEASRQITEEGNEINKQEDGPDEKITDAIVDASQEHPATSEKNSLTDEAGGDGLHIGMLPELVLRNDTITIGRNRILPLNQPEKLKDENELSDSKNECRDAIFTTEDAGCEKDKMDPKIQMSYDSGLNSIDNESILDDDSIYQHDVNYPVVYSDQQVYKNSNFQE